MGPSAFRAWIVARAFLPGVVTLTLLAFTTFMIRLDSQGAHDEVPNWLWSMIGSPMQFACIACATASLGSFVLTESRDRSWTLLVNLPPLLPLWALNTLS